MAQFNFIDWLYENGFTYVNKGSLKYFYKGNDLVNVQRGHFFIKEKKVNPKNKSQAKKLFLQITKK